MKKYLFPALTFMILSAFAGCSKTESQNLQNFNKNINNNINQNKGNKKMEHLTAETFKTKVFNYEVNKEWKFEGEIPCIVDFYADWCGPCKMVAPILEELSMEYDGRINIYKVDTDKEQELSAVFGIRSIPSILFVPMNGQPQMSMGAMSKEAFKDAIEKILLNSKN